MSPPAPASQCPSSQPFFQGSDRFHTVLKGICPLALRGDTVHGGQSPALLPAPHSSPHPMGTRGWLRHILGPAHAPASPRGCAVSSCWMPALLCPGHRAATITPSRGNKLPEDGWGQCRVRVINREAGIQEAAGRAGQQQRGSAAEAGAHEGLR